MSDQPSILTHTSNHKEHEDTTASDQGLWTCIFVFFVPFVVRKCSFFPKICQTPPRIGGLKLVS